VPRWVQGRALAVYQIAIQGGLAGASALWGVIGVRYGLQIALWSGAASLLAGFVTYSWRLAAADEVETDVVVRPSPESVMDIDPDSGPVLITIEYRIDPALTEEFVSAMRQLRVIRLRDGAVFWGLFVDTVRPDRFIENFVSETWVEHLRLHERRIESDVVYEERARSFQLGDAPPVTHLISADAVAGHHPGSFRAGRVTVAVRKSEPSEPALKKVQL